MKTLKTSLLIAALVLSSVLSATTVKKEKSVTNLTEEIGTLLQNPNFEVGEDITASVDIILNKEHEIVVLSVDAPDSSIEGFIKKRLNYKHVETLNTIEGEPIKVPLRFTAEK